MESTPNAHDPLHPDDVEGHGLLGNAAIAAALTVGGSVGMTSPAFADATAIDLSGADPRHASYANMLDEVLERVPVHEPDWVNPARPDPESSEDDPLSVLRDVSTSLSAHDIPLRPL